MVVGAGVLSLALKAHAQVARRGGNAPREIAPSREVGAAKARSALRGMPARVNLGP
jgi:hypothetical protein